MQYQDPETGQGKQLACARCYNSDIKLAVIYEDLHTGEFSSITETDSPPFHAWCPTCKAACDKDATVWLVDDDPTDKDPT